MIGTLIPRTRELAKRVEVDFEGKRVPADQLNFTSNAEPWTEYELEDGTVIRIKSVLAQVFRVVDQYLPNGEPVYVMQIGNLPVVTIPSELKRHAPTESAAEEEER